MRFSFCSFLNEAISTSVGNSFGTDCLELEKNITAKISNSKTGLFTTVDLKFQKDITVKIHDSNDNLVHCHLLQVIDASIRIY